MIVMVRRTGIAYEDCEDHVDNLVIWVPTSEVGNHTPISLVSSESGVVKLSSSTASLCRPISVVIDSSLQRGIYDSRIKCFSTPGHRCSDVVTMASLEAVRRWDPRLRHHGVVL